MKQNANLATKGEEEKGYTEVGNTKNSVNENDYSEIGNVELQNLTTDGGGGGVKPSAPSAAEIGGLENPLYDNTGDVVTNIQVTTDIDYIDNK